MNKKRTNRLVAILNVVAIASIYIMYFSSSYLLTSIMSGDNGGKSVYDSFIIDTLLNNIQIILTLVHGGIGIINIICAIQNKENKKIFFWQLIFGIYEIWSAISLGIFMDNDDVLAWGERIICDVVPIILAIVNFVRIRKNRPKVIQIISYLAVIILSILDLLNIIGAYWNIIAIIMQFIYIHFQDKYIEENNTRKILNIILYYVIQVIVSVGFFFMVISSLLITKVNDVKWEKSLSEMYNNIETLQGAKTNELYIPVEKNLKYGFITEDGKEKIPCEYDRVSYFNEIEINNNTYYIAFAKKDNKFYIISKTNNSIEINGDLEKYVKSIDNHLGTQMIDIFNKDGDYRLAYLQSFEFYLQVFTRRETKLTQQILEKNYYGTDSEINLTEKNSKYIYKNSKYSMIIEPIYDETEDEDYDYDSYYNNYYDEEDDDDMYYISSSETKYKVTLTKTNGEVQSSIVYLPGIDEYEETLETFTNGYIEFESEDRTRKGWYDSDGNQITIPSNYTIEDIKDNKIILQVYNDYDDENYDENAKTEFNFIIIDMEGKILLQTTALDIYDNMYLVKNNNNKMVLVDEDLKTISNEYDKIITTKEIDISANYSSYY